MPDYPLPRKVQIGPHPYRVHAAGDVDQVAHGHDKTSEEAEGLFGHADHRNGVILIGTDMVLSQQQDTLLHEVLHAVLVPVGEDKEELVWRITAPLLDTLQRNPRMVEYLMQRQLIK